MDRRDMSFSHSSNNWTKNKKPYWANAKQLQEVE